MSGALAGLAGATAVVTGAGSGIGRSLALAWAADGMDVVVADVDLDAAERVAAEVEERGVRALAVRCDVADPDSVAALAARARELGEVRMLCNNAGVYLDRPLLDAELADWHRVFGVNVFGVVHCVDAFLPAMRALGGPCFVVNTASDAGVMNHLPDGAGDEDDQTEGVPWGVYQASKHAVVSYTEQLANALAGTSVEVAALCPSGVATPMTEMRGIEPDAVAAILREALAAGRFYVFTGTDPRDPARRRCASIDAGFEGL